MLSHPQTVAPKGIVIAAPQSGSGKTAFAQALVRYWINRGQAGKKVIPAKVGPDYIDPQFLAAAAKSDECFNLDHWAMRPESLVWLMRHAQRQYTDPFWVIEGVMGLFDGAADGNGGSTADIAALCGMPLVLVVDVKRQSTSIAALIQGFQKFRSDICLAAVVLNNVGSVRHQRMLRQAIQQFCPHVAILAMIPHHVSWRIPSRHLGLVQAADMPEIDHQQHMMADHLARHLDGKVLENLLHAACDEADHSTNKPWQEYPGDIALLPPPAQRIAMAQDAAFSFVYAGQCAAWRAAGAEVIPFSPLADEAPDPQAECILLPGGYPELHLPTLVAAKQFHRGMRQAAQSGVNIHGECGGYMVLGQTIEREAQHFPMLGLLPVAFHFSDKRRVLGYRRITLAQDCLWGKRGQCLRGHEFHYGETVALNSSQKNATPLYQATDALGNSCDDGGKIVCDTGIRFGNISGSFIHLIDREVSVNFNPTEKPPDVHKG